MKLERAAESFDVDDILEDLESDRRSGILPSIVTASSVRYGVDPDDPERLVAVDAAGKHVLPPS